MAMGKICWFGPYEMILLPNARLESLDWYFGS